MKFDTVISNSYYHETENLLLVKVKDIKELTVENVALNNEQTFQVMGNRVTKVIYDVRNLEFSQIPKEVLRYIADSPHSRYQEAEAFVVAGLGQKLIANFYLAVMKPKTKTKMFTSFDNALEWHKVGEKQNIANIHNSL